MQGRLIALKTAEQGQIKDNEIFWEWYFGKMSDGI